MKKLKWWSRRNRGAARGVEGEPAGGRQNQALGDRRHPLLQLFPQRLRQRLRILPGAPRSEDP